MDQGWAQERARLAGIEALWDPGTCDVLTRSGVAPGSRVLEVGAGGGSIVQWLAVQVGHSGRVVAVDIDVRFVAPLASDVVEVCEVDVVTGELPAAQFDVVHARLLLEHLKDPAAVVLKLVDALIPGGRLVVEDYDWSGFGFESDDALNNRVTEGILSFMAAAGFDRTFGRRLVGVLAGAGLGPVEGNGRSLVVDCTHPGYDFFRLSFEQLAPGAERAGLIAADDVRMFRNRLDAGGPRVITPTLVTGIGHRPVP
ncbi:methyltransferase domain-containing protein [Lapillicoccus sp.]|uniref:methyltransferase domain-containing protein n=1 Tax=Lapillicoccus sp. TaxID=1909287 RepID=UPI00326792F1